MKTFLAILLFCSQLALAQAPPAGSQLRSVHLAWDANPEPDIKGYRLHWGTETGAYPITVDVGNTTTGTLEVPATAGLYYAVVTAYNTAGLESLPSNEVSFSVVGPSRPTGVKMIRVSVTVEVDQ